LVPGIFRYRTYLKWEYTDGIWNRYTRDIQIGTSYSREGGRGIFSLISILDPVGTPLKNGMPGFSGRSRGIL